MIRPFAFLVLEAHPYGREMLRALLDTGLEPLALIEERSDIAEEERHKFEVRMAGLELAPGFDEQLAGRATRRCVVPHHNGDECQALLEQLRPQLLVLGGTRILRKRIFERAAHTLNAHPGLLPQLRGSASVAWAIATDHEVGCTCHFIDAGIDTGPIVSRERIPVHRGDTYELLCWKTTRLSARLMAKAVRDYFDGTISSTAQESGGTTYRNMPEDGVAEVKRKLAEGRYVHYVD